MQRTLAGLGIPVAWLHCLWLPDHSDFTLADLPQPLVDHIERASKLSKPRGPYRKADNVALLAELRPIIDQRPTYGYRRVTALLNRQWRKEGKPTVNTKRVLRIMRQNGFTLQKHTALRPTRTHDGVVVALRSKYPLVFRSSGDPRPQ